MENIYQKTSMDEYYIKGVMKNWECNWQEERAVMLRNVTFTFNNKSTDQINRTNIVTKIKLVRRIDDLSFEVL